MPNNNTTQTTNANSAQTRDELEGGKKQQETPERQPERMENATTTPARQSGTKEKDRYDNQKGGNAERSNSGSDRSNQSGSGSEANSSQREGSNQSNVNR